MTTTAAAAPPPIGWHSRFARLLGLGHGLFFAVSGAWPIVHLRSFLFVTGPKVDLWLVQTVGALLAVTGIALAWAARRSQLNGAWALLAAGQAGALAAVDIIFVTRDRISPIYLADAAVELALVLAWAVAATQAHRAALKDTTA